MTKDLETLIQGTLLKDQRESEKMEQLFLGCNCNAKNLLEKGAAGCLMLSSVVLLVRFLVVLSFSLVMLFCLAHYTLYLSRERDLKSPEHQTQHHRHQFLRSF